MLLVILSLFLRESIPGIDTSPELIQGHWLSTFLLQIRVLVVKIRLNKEHCALIVNRVGLEYICRKCLN